MPEANLRALSVSVVISSRAGGHIAGVIHPAHQPLELHQTQGARDGGCGQGRLAHQLIQMHRLGANQGEEDLFLRGIGHCLPRLALLGHHGQVQLLQDILCLGHQLGLAALDEGIGAFADPIIDVAGHGKGLAALFQSELDGDERAALAPRLDDQGAQGETTDDPVTGWKVNPLWFCAQGIIGDEGASLDDGFGQLAVAGRIDDV